MTNLDSRARARLDAGLAAVCQRVGIDPRGAELLHYTVNAVYRVENAGVVVRLTKATNEAVVTKVAKAAAAFAGLGLPTARLAPEVDQPIHTDGWSATIWVYLPQPPGHRHEPADLAAPLLAIHAVPCLDFPLPQWDPVGRARTRLTKAAGLGGTDAEFLQQWADQQLHRPLDTVLGQLQQQCDELTALAADAEWTLPWPRPTVSMSLPRRPGTRCAESVVSSSSPV